jgi:tetratricopeptide (TPR) repeat protein
VNELKIKMAAADTHLNTTKKPEKDQEKEHTMTTTQRNDDNTSPPNPLNSSSKGTADFTQWLLESSTPPRLVSNDNDDEEDDNGKNEKNGGDQKTKEKQQLPTAQDNKFMTKDMTTKLPQGFPEYRECLDQGNIMYEGHLFQQAWHMYNQVIRGILWTHQKVDTEDPHKYIHRLHSHNEYPLVLEAICSRIACMGRLGKIDAVESAMDTIHQEEDHAYAGIGQLYTYYNNYAQLAYMRKRFKEAAHHTAESLKQQRDPQINKEAYRLRGLIAWAVGQHQVALKSWDALDYGNDDIQCLKGRVLCEIQQPKTALQVIDTALEQRQSAPLYEVRGNALCLLERHYEAVSSYQVAISLTDETSSDVMANLYAKKGSLLYFLGDFKNAMTSYKAAIQENPQHFLSHYNMATLFYKQGNHDKALQYANDSVRLCPNDSSSYALKSELLNLQNQFEKGLESANKTIELNQDSTEARREKAKALKAMGRYMEALQEHSLLCQNYAGMGSLLVSDIKTDQNEKKHYYVSDSQDKLWQQSYADMIAERRWLIEYFTVVSMYTHHSI